MEDLMVTMRELSQSLILMSSVEKNESDCINLKKKNFTTFGALMLYKLLPGSNKNLLYFDKFHSLPNEAKRYVISPLKLN
jgi:hypothetical protein